MPVNQSNNGKNINSQLLKTEANSEKKVSLVLRSPTKNQSDLEKVSRPEESIETKKPNRNREPIFSKLKAKTAILVGGVVMLPILAVGTATYYFGTQAIDKQIVLARRANNLDLVQTELVRQQNLLAALLIGTGTTALVAGAVAGLGTKRLIDRESESTSKQTPAARSIGDLNWQQDIFQATVEQARTDLNCDRVVVCRLDYQYGLIISESVVAGYTQGIGKTIPDSIVGEYLDDYRSGKAKAIDDIERFNLSASDREQLKRLEVKACLITPILSRGRLLGLLIAHQCNAPRKWQRTEIDLLHRAAEKAGLTVENSRLCDRLARLQTKAEKERKCRDYFNDAVNHIRQALEPEDILNISVEEVHRVLKCDRVVVYSLDRDEYGVVVAESVSAGYSRALNKTVEEFFEAKYLDLYRDGRVREIDNIYEAELSQRYLEQLEALEVKASLITPILDKDRLFGLLVAHQCDRPRNWQDYEIRWTSQIATQVSFALDNARVLAESATVRDRAETEKKWTHYFDDAVRHIHQSLEPKDILNISVEEVHRVLQCDRVVVYSLDSDKHGVVVAESVSAGYSRALNKTVEEPFEAKYLDLYRDGRVRGIDNIYEAELSQRYLEQLEALEVKASAVAPILSRGKLFGLIVAHQCDRPRNWQDHEIRWTSQIATQVGFALDNAIVSKKLQHHERSTQLLKDFSLRISQTANKSELLNTAVEQVRKIIKLDRAIVYQFDVEDRAAIVAESVVSGYPQTLVVEDLYLTKEPREKDSSMTEAIANIHCADLTDSRLKQLEFLAVKAIITVPIKCNRQLFGLLIGHQCQQPRSWSQHETDLFTQLALQIGLVLDRVTLEELTSRKNSQNNEDDTKLSNLTPTPDRAIVKATDIELEQLQPDLHQMLGTLHDIQDSDRQAKVKSLQLPIEDITVEVKEITLDSANPEPDLIAGEFVEKLPSTSEVAIAKQSQGDITELSERISQQSLFVTESFQKLATFAKQLSEEDKK